MSTAIVERSASQSVELTSHWIISKRDDLIWFIGSALAGYLSLAIISGVHSTTGIAILAFVWSILINGPHLYATATRTYFDSEQRHKLSWLLWLIIPVSFASLIFFKVGGVTLFVVFSSAWGTFHVAKQHLGIVMLYKRVNGERDKKDFRLDKWFLLVSQMLPLVLFVCWYAGLPAPGELFAVALIIEAILIAWYGYRQVVKYRANEEMNWPKLMLLTLVIPLSWLAYVCALNSSISGVFVFSIAINIGHALQYHRLTWFHNRNRYQGRPGLSGLLSGSVVYYYGAALLLSLFFVLLAPTVLPFHGAEFLLIGPTFMHYVLDARIWRVRADPELARALRLV